MGPSGYSRNLLRGRTLAQLWPQVVPLGSLGWLAQHLGQESLAPSQGSVEVAKRMDSGRPLAIVESCEPTSCVCLLVCVCWGNNHVVTVHEHAGVGVYGSLAVDGSVWVGVLVNLL